MKISLLNDSFPPFIDGVANTVVNYADNLIRLGDDVNVITPKNPQSDDSRFNYPVLRYPGLDVRDYVGYIAGYPFSPYISSTLADFSPDILHSHCPVASTTLARGIRKNLDAPLILTYHTKFDIDIENAIKGKLLQEGAINALINNVSACDEVWVVSDGAGKNLKDMGYKGDYIVMENGVDVPRGRMRKDEYMTVCAKYGFDLPDGVPVFLFVGRLMWYKGIRIIIDALSALKYSQIDYRMVFIGSGRDEKEITEYVKTCGIEDKVFFTGPIYDRNELISWYCRSELFLFPSTFDTNGLVVREAAACSLPSVLIDGSCAADGVINNVNGFLIGEDAASMAALLTRVCIDWRGRLRQIGDNASQTIYISWADAVAKAHERYEIVAENYKLGLYKKRPRPEDELFNISGDLMKFVANARETGSRAKQAGEDIKKDIADNFAYLKTSFQNNIQGVEAGIRDNIQGVQDEIRSLFDDLYL